MEDNIYDFLVDIKEAINIINIRMDNIENDIYSIKTWTCDFDRVKNEERKGKTLEKGAQSVKKNTQNADEEEYFITKTFSKKTLK